MPLILYYLRLTFVLSLSVSFSCCFINSFFFFLIFPFNFVLNYVLSPTLVAIYRYFFSSPSFRELRFWVFFFYLTSFYLKSFVSFHFLHDFFFIIPGFFFLHFLLQLFWSYSKKYRSSTLYLSRADLKNVPLSVSNWSKEWILYFNTYKMKLLSFKRLREPFLSSIKIFDANFQKNDPIRLFGLTVSADIKWNDNIEAIVRSAAIKVGYLCRAWQFFSRQNIPYVFISLPFVLSLFTASTSGRFILLYI